MKNLKKIISITLMFLGLMMPVTSNAQIYLMDIDEEDNSLREGSDDFWFTGGVPYQGGDDDQYVPLADGMLLLAGLGGAYYLLNKRKKED